MNLVRCENGHFYDEERFTECPFCNQTVISTVNKGDDEKQYTLPLDSDSNETAITDPDPTEFNKTIGYFGDMKTEPVTGWFVAISGEHFGEDFKLKSGRNFIGRSPEMDVALVADNSISREKHAVILYEPRSNTFMVQPGDAKELFYLNDKVVLEATKINANDIISLGETNLLFIPCCSSKFNWDDVKPKDNE